MESILMYVVGPVVTAVVSFFIGRRQARAESVKTELDNVEEMARMWRETAENYQQKFAESDALVEELRDLMLQYKTQHQEVLSKLTALEADYNSLNKKYNELKKK